MFVTRKRLSRRTMLRGLGATIALPLLDAMTPAGRALAATRARPPRLICMEMVHGAAGSTPLGIAKNLWAPAAAGRAFDLSPTSLASLEPFREHLTIVSNTDVPMADAYAVREVGGDHFRSSAAFLTQAHPKQTMGADVEAGISLDQLHAQRFGQDTPLPSVQMCIEPIDAAGGCGYGYSCVYTDAISWSAPHRPLPMDRDPRVVFDKLFGAFRDGLSAEERLRRLGDERSILDWVIASVPRLARALGPADRARLDDYLQNIREVERRIQNVEAYSRRGEAREFPEAPPGVPDSFSEHVKLMFDLQVLALAADITRVFAFKLGRDNSNRVYPESGFDGPFHPASHHSGREAKILNFARINAYHVGLVPYLLAKLKETRDGERTLLDSTLVLYGSPMGDSNDHNHKKVPFFLAGHAGGTIKGGRHLRASNGALLADVMLSVLHALGHDDLASFGESEGTFDLNG